MNIEKTISDASSKLLVGYKGGNLDLPNPDKIINILEMLKKVIFPEHFSAVGESSAPSIHLQALMTDIHRELTTQIRTVAPESGAVLRLFENLPLIQELLYKDAQAGFDGDPAAKNADEVILTYPGFLAVFIHRIAHFLYTEKVPLIPRMMSEYAHSVTGIDIHPGAQIGEYFFIDHGTGVVIGETTIIGDHVKLYQSVTLGALSTRSGQKLAGIKRHPTIEDNVIIYSGASILGGDTVIGEGAVIGGNTFIVKSVPAHTAVKMKKMEVDTVLRTPKL